MNTNIRTTLKKIRILKMIKLYLDRILNKIIIITNGLGSKRKCYICGKTFNKFTEFRGGSKGIPQFRKQLDGVSSDSDNFRCMYCGCHDRERHLFMFFDILVFWQRMKDVRILHFAPEKHLRLKISQQTPLEYVKADLYPKNHDIQKIDATAIPFSNDMFDF